MSIHDDHDDLRLALDAIAGAGAGTARPEQLLRTVRGRVRRRRAAKQVGIGATTLAVGGALAFGAVQLVPRALDPGPVGPATTPTVSATEPSPGPDPTEPTQPAPTTPSTPPVEPVADCSAAGGSTDVDLTGLPEPAQQTLRTLVQAAAACDADTLIALAQRDGTHLNFGANDPVETWTLPDAEADEPVYEILRALLTQTSWAPYTIESADDAVVWPRVFTPENAEDDAAWQEAIDAGAVPADLAADMRAAGEYLGWRVAITAEGTWQFFTGGD
ncbi:hypothetical protein Xcel_0334 [Xylanimonas cellulosilytica DSM 15894]|uniref:Uncharacterized protein n=1 Tax=Xylanimonas cellulosilytica (strain DSM 15894 / JCM 12276 / CECT 5975 / KCTC 9989 / LMG 20990 / NBRC 107835 / XIL07) TaxID=446471 RepID=D1BVA2_XYLCX|nr:hypothetical protein [Xylanimonas cellulosilytica]ACZ29373.1 hypothetical protein Xcel_0334 [Xylanimonas cellulosilytica DSM 15894]